MEYKEPVQLIYYSQWLKIREMPTDTTEQIRLKS